MALSHGAVLAAILVALSAIGYLLLSRNLDGEATNALTQAAAQQTDRMREAGRPLPPLDSDVPSARAIQTAVFLGDGIVLGEKADLPPWLHPYPQHVHNQEISDEDVRVVTLRTSLADGRHVAVAAGRSLAPEEDLLDRLQLAMLIGGAVAVAAAMGAGWILAGRAIRPIRRAYEAQATFTADASHELRTPLAFVRSGVEVLAKDGDQLGQDVVSEIDYLQGLTDRLLTMARADEGSLAMRIQPVRLSEITDRSIRRAEHVQGLEVGQGAPSTDGATVLADPVALEAVVDVVLENVARHGGGEATITVAPVDGRYQMRVADRGPGIDPPARSAAFERFSRRESSRSRDAGGAGLGLSLAKALVAAQSGRIWLEETPGGGLTVVVELPANGIRARYR
jgi:signal transduction histidine kinase